MDTRNLTLAGLVFEAKFEPNLAVTNYFSDLQQEIKGDYQLREFIYHRVDFANRKNTETMFFSIENIGLTTMIVKDKHEKIKEIKNLLEFAEKSGLKKFTRIGIRTDIVVPIKESDLSKEMEIFFTKFFGKQAIKQLGNSIGEFELKLSSIDDQYKYILNFKFAEREDKDNAELKYLPKLGLVCDTDCYKDEVSIEEAYDFVSHAMDASINRIRNFLSNFLVRSEK